nr:hypothetical protein [Tanacetum cinerariifolium]
MLRSCFASRIKNTDGKILGKDEGAAIAIPINVVEEFATKEGMERVIENGPWLIRLHHVPIIAYSKVCLRLITTQIGHPIMLDSYTSTMCLKSEGRNTYARALIKVSSKKELMQYLVVAILLPNGKGPSLETIKVEYEWEPPRCTECKIFDHVDNQCPKKQKVEEPA